jgi:hypothetical protein
MVKFYQKYAPQKVQTISQMLATFAGREEAMLDHMEQQYKAPGFFAEARPGIRQRAAARAAQGGGAPAAQPASSAPSSAAPPTGAPNPAIQPILVQFYQRYAPQKVATVGQILQVFAGREAEMFTQLEAQYNAPGYFNEARNLLKGAPLSPAPPQSKQQPKLAASPSAAPRVNTAAILTPALTAFYQTYAPAKVANVGQMIATFQGREEEMLSNIERQYNAPQYFAATRAALAGTPPAATAVAPPSTPAKKVVAQTVSATNPSPAAAATPASPAVSGPSGAKAPASAPLSKAPVSQPSPAQSQPQPSPGTPVVSAASNPAVSPAPEQPASASPTAMGKPDLALQPTLERFYQQYAPQKVGTVSTILATFSGREEVMMDQLERQYNANGYFRDARQELRQRKASTDSQARATANVSNMLSGAYVPTPEEVERFRRLQEAEAAHQAEKEALERRRQEIEQEARANQERLDKEMARIRQEAQDMVESERRRAQQEAQELRQMGPSTQTGPSSQAFSPSSDRLQIAPSVANYPPLNDVQGTGQGKGVGNELLTMTEGRRRVYQFADFYGVSRLTVEALMARHSDDEHRVMFDLLCIVFPDGVANVVENESQSTALVTRRMTHFFMFHNRDRIPRVGEIMAKYRGRLQTALGDVLLKYYGETLKNVPLQTVHPDQLQHPDFAGIADRWCQERPFYSTERAGMGADGIPFTVNTPPPVKPLMVDIGVNTNPPVTSRDVASITQDVRPLTLDSEVETDAPPSYREGPAYRADLNTLESSMGYNALRRDRQKKLYTDELLYGRTQPISANGGSPTLPSRVEKVLDSSVVAREPTRCSRCVQFEEQLNAVKQKLYLIRSQQQLKERYEQYLSPRRQVSSSTLGCESCEALTHQVRVLTEKVHSLRQNRHQNPLTHGYTPLDGGSTFLPPGAALGSGFSSVPFAVPQGLRILGREYSEAELLNSL